MYAGVVVIGGLDFHPDRPEAATVRGGLRQALRPPLLNFESFRSGAGPVSK